MPNHQVTELLRQWSEGDEKALDELMPVIYAELHQLAHKHIRREKVAPNFPVLQRHA